jgi:hypothetical protein
VIRLDPTKLTNPDADIRYLLPDMLVERSKGLIADDGYDYVGKQPLMLISLTTSDLKAALRLILDVIQHAQVLGNQLSESAVVAVEQGTTYQIVFPQDYQEPFLPE